MNKIYLPTTIGGLTLELKKFLTAKKIKEFIEDTKKKRKLSRYAMNGYVCRRLRAMLLTYKKN